MSRLEQLREVAWLEALAAAAVEEAGKRREALRAEAVEEFRTQGFAPTWRSPIGSVTLAVSKDKVDLTNPSAFGQWVEQRYPDAIQHIAQVSAGWKETFLASLEVEGDKVVDPSTGEIVPGLVFKPGGRPLQLSVRLDPSAKKVLALTAEAGLKHAALVAGPSVPVVIAELEQGSAEA